MSKLIAVLAVVMFVGVSMMATFADVTQLFGIDVGRILVIIFAVGAMPTIWKENEHYED